MTDLGSLVAALSRPSAYPHPADPVRVVQTHVSVVFLAGDRAYKLKKPVDLGFLDFSTVEKRRHACEREVALNERLARGVYLGVVSVVRREGELAVGGEGEPVEPLVAMQRLPDERTLDHLLRRGEVDAALLVRLARRLAAFHAVAASRPDVVAGATWPAVAATIRGNLDQVRPFVGSTLRQTLHARLVRATEDELESRRELIERRAAAGIPRDTHGDLRLEHVYVLPDRAPDDLVIVDCIEFSDALRHADPVADAAFLAMDLQFAGRPDLAAAFVQAWSDARGDAESLALVPLHVGYRHVVRGKVRSIEASEREVPAEARVEAAERARRHFLMALGALAPPAERPCLVLTCGLPGTGKTTIARDLERASGFTRISSDETRKELAGVEPTARAAAPPQAGLYAPEWTERTYAELEQRAQRVLLDGGRPVVDASFREEHRRARFLDLGRQLGVPALLLRCEAAPDVVRRRLAARTGDASDADWRVHVELLAAWERESPATAAATHVVRTDGTPEDALAQALSALAAAGVA